MLFNLCVENILSEDLEGVETGIMVNGIILNNNTDDPVILVNSV